MKLYSSILLISAFFFSCNEKPKVQKKNFETFEISFSDGWHTQFLYKIDSNQKYFKANFSHENFSINGYFKGELGDSVFKIINDNAFKIKFDKSIHSIEHGCCDCPSMAIFIKDQNKNYELHYWGSIDTTFTELINIFYKDTIVDNKLYVDTTLDLEHTIFPPLKPEVKFTKPKNK